MELTSTMFVSLDGVYQGPGGPNEDTSGGFDRGGWLVPYFDEGAGQFMGDVFGQVDAFLLGRKTYEIFASFWPKATDPNSPDAAVAHALNSLPKYVPSSTLRDPTWAGTSVISSDLKAVPDLKSQSGRELQVHGSGMLVRSLLAADLLDRLNLLVFPVIVGKGRRLFPDSGIDIGLALESSRTTGSGVTINTYRPTGRATFGEIPGA
jgi:dihydrofolate reductase